MKSIREIVAGAFAPVAEIFKSPSKKRLEAAGSASVERENTYVTIKVPKIEPDPVKFFVPDFYPDQNSPAADQQPKVFIGDVELIPYDPAAEIIPDYGRHPVVPADFLIQLIRETAERRRADRRDFYRRKKSQAKKWRKWRS